MSAESIRIEPVRGRRELKSFIDLPNRLYRRYPKYVAPLAWERRQTLSREHNPYFRHAEVELWIAWRGRRPIGRISAQIDRASLERYRDATGHFGFLDAEDDPSVFRLLTRTAEQWLSHRGMRRARGPFSLSIHDECGLLIQGFEERAMVLMGFVPPYVSRRLAEQGYIKAKDLVCYDYDITQPLPDRAARFVRWCRNRARVTVRNADMSRYREEVALVLDIYNDAWSENWSFVPVSNDHMNQIADSLRLLLRPELVCIAEVDNDPACMIVCVPNLSEAIAGLGGKLIPFGWMKLLWRLKISGLETCRVPLFGVRRRYHRSPLATAMLVMTLDTLRRGMIADGFRHAELSWTLEDNLQMRRVMDGIGARAYKTYRIFDKDLN